MIKKLLILCLLIVPMAEIFIFICVGKWIGTFSTLMLTMATSWLGLFLVRREGRHAYHLSRVQLRNGQLPGRAILDGVLVLIGGYLLLIPGFLTDIVGFLCIWPYTRNLLVFWGIIIVERKIVSDHFRR